MKYAMQKVYVNTKNPSEVTVNNLMKEALDFANKNNMPFRYGIVGERKVWYEVEAEGRTSAYCKGLVLELKEIVKQSFGRKLEVVAYMY